jgi:hypothetical protein
MSEFSMGSDHEVYEEGSWRIPAIYLNDWPDRYIHTNLDVAANIDPTKLKRAAFIGAASGYVLATQTAENSLELLQVLDGKYEIRFAASKYRFPMTRGSRDTALSEFYHDYMAETEYSVYAFLKKEGIKRQVVICDGPEIPETRDEGKVRFIRTPKPKGPMSVFGYDYFIDKYGKEKARSLKLLTYQGLRGAGSEYAYEVLNFVDGVRNAQQIRDAVSAEYGPVPLEHVVEYLRALESIGVIQKLK